MKIYCCNLTTQEVYECNKDKAIADIRKWKECSELEAINQLLDSSINNPLILNDKEEMWVE